VKDRGRRPEGGGGVNGNPIKFLSKETGLCPHVQNPKQKPMKESDEDY
jgi:hypothetical protein